MTSTSVIPTSMISTSARAVRVRMIDTMPIMPAAMPSMVVVVISVMAEAKGIDPKDIGCSHHHGAVGFRAIHLAAAGDCGDGDDGEPPLE
jgi:hypothetical protein